MKPKVYLAGKRTEHGWRDAIVPRGCIDCTDEIEYEYETPWKPRHAPNEWALRSGMFYDITGPFFIGCDHGCTHGRSTHAIAGGCVQSHYGEMRDVARRLCLAAIRRSDIVFAWLDDVTAYGTIAEIGYASALGKRIVVVVPPCTTKHVHEWVGIDTHLEDYQTCECMRHGDTWFVAGMPGVEVIEAASPNAAWAKFLAGN